MFFTVFCSPNIPIHPTEIEKASDVYERNFGNHILKVSGNACRKMPGKAKGLLHKSIQYLQLSYSNLIS